MTEAWLVVDPQGRRSVFLDHARALSYATRVSGVLYELVRRYDS